MTIKKKTTETKHIQSSKLRVSNNNNSNDCGCVVQTEDDENTKERSLEHFIHEYLTHKYIKSSPSSSFHN